MALDMFKEIFKENFDLGDDNDDNKRIRNISNKYNSNNKLSRRYFDSLYLVDVSTGKAVNIETVQDSSRYARSAPDPADNPSVGDTIVYKKNINGQLLSDLLSGENAYFDMNPKECVASVGQYVSTYIQNRIKSNGDKDKPLDAINRDSEIINKLTFRGYVNGSNSSKDYNGKNNGNDGLTNTKDGQDKKTPRMFAGIGLGESTVLNPPFQFNKRDDPRTNPVFARIGRVYSTQIMNNWPIALIQPGRFKYNTSFMKLLGFGGSAAANELLIRTGGEGLKGAIAKVFTAVTDTFSVVGSVASAIFGGNRAVEFRQAYNLFKVYVNFLWKMMAGNMGLVKGARGEYVGAIDDISLHKVLPTNILTPDSLLGGGGLTKYLNDQYLPFRCGKGITASESFSNSMSSNPLMEKINEMSNANNEAANGDAGTKLLFGSGIKNTIQTGALKLAANFSDGAAVAAGKGYISLPDVFTSSSFSRSFSFDFKFHSPYGDPLSIFENEYIPYLTLLALTAPRQTGKLSYTSPFAVRISVKSKTMINYGMVESLSITRGGDSNDWTPQGYPKTLNVSLSIKDMQPNIMLPMASRGPLRSALEVMFPTTGISEYLASLGSLSMYDFGLLSRFKRSTQMFTSSWNTKLDLDNIFSTVANTRIISNLMGLIATSDLDKAHKLGSNMVASKDATISEAYYNVVPGYYEQAIMNNGNDAIDQLKLDRATQGSAINELGNNSDIGINYPFV